MAGLRFLTLVTATLVVCGAKRLIFENKHNGNIWVGSLGNSGKPAPNGGGWEMRPGQSMTLDVDDAWAGRFWARTGCRFDGNGNGPCETGDCGNKLKCNGAGGRPPVTLVEMTFKGWQGNDYYDISLVDGYNVKASMAPLDRQGGGDQYRCTRTACDADINSQCPNELRDNQGGRVVACKSACEAFQTDTYCCRGQHNRPETCRSSDWPKDYPAFFKRLCSDAYSYAYDDHKSTWTCADTGYKITFG